MILDSQKNVALIGAGYWGKNLLRNFYQLGVLKTVCDVSLDYLESFKKPYPDVIFTDSLESVLSDSSIKRIVIATPAETHYQVAKKALIAGKDVFVEKPLCLIPREGDDLIRLATDRGLILFVGHLLHYHPYMIELKRLIETSVLGDIRYISSHRLNLGKIRQEEDSLWSLAPHDISVLLSLCGYQEIVSMDAFSGTELTPGVCDMSMLHLTFSRGIKAHIYVSWLNPIKERRLTVIGDKAVAVFDDMLPWNQKLQLFRDPVMYYAGSRIAHNPNCKPDMIIVPEKEPLMEECKAFLHHCDTRTRPLTDGQEAVRVLEVLQAAGENIKKKQTEVLAFA